MSWHEQIRPDSAIWHGVIAYARERIEELTQVCTSPESSEAAIRAAQSGIDEMRRLIGIPSRIQATVQHRSTPARTTGY